MYMEGDGVEKDEDKTVELLRTAAHSPNAEALTKLGDLYVGGRCGLTRSYKKALNCYDKATDMGYAPAWTAKGILYESIYEDYRKATDFYTKAAEMGDLEAKSSLSRMYYFGKGTVPDYPKAKAYAEEAAVMGDDKSVYLLAWMYYLGDGTEADAAQALYWFSRCCDDMPEAMRLVGVLLREDTPYRDERKAMQALKLAADRRDAEAIRLIGDEEVDVSGIGDGYFTVPYCGAYEDSLRTRLGIPIPAADAPAEPRKKSFFARIFGRK